MLGGKFLTVRAVTVALAGLLAACNSSAQTHADAAQIQVADLNRQIRDFIEQQVTAHVADIKTLNPLPDRVVGGLATGEFSWGTFMRALAAYSEFAGTRTIAGHDVVKMIGDMALIELNHGGKTWAQLYAAMALKSFGTDLHHNALWLELTPQEREAYRTLLDPGRFYDAKTHTLIHLPENYFGVAARIAAISYQLGLNTDRATLDDLLDHAARQFTDGALFADDAIPTGRYDRYSNEYARAVYDAAAIAGRADIIKALGRSLKAQMQLWWDLLSPDGYGYSWGRSLGDISYMDTMEIVAFVAEHPEFRPVSIPQLASAYYRAWRSLRNDFNDDTHLLSVFAFGRGDYSYITKEREWQQTTTFFGKIIGAHQEFMRVLEGERITSFPANLTLPDVNRYVSFRSGPGRQFGVWVVREENFHFALPFVTGPRAATSDYQPAPHGLDGFAAPVEKIYPCLTPFLELDDGKTIAASDGADQIRFSQVGRSLTATWTRWVAVGTKAGGTVDPGLTTQVTWTIQEGSLQRSEVITAAKPVRIRRFWVTVPSIANHSETTFLNDTRRDLLFSNDVNLEVQLAHTDWPLRVSAFATGDDPLGRGPRGPIPLHLILESKDISLVPDVPRRWDIKLSFALAKNSATARGSSTPFENIPHP